MSGGFLQLTTEQMNELTLDQLKVYYGQVSQIIDEQTSTINADTVIQSQYQYLILQSESTINSIASQQIFNSNAIAASVMASNEAVSFNSTNMGLMMSYNSSIAAETDKIFMLSVQVSSLTLESENLNSTLASQDKIFTSSAIGYSTLYLDFTTKDALYQQSLADISTTSSYLVSSMIAEDTSKRVLDLAMNAYNASSQDLSTLITQGAEIHSTVIQYRIDEVAAIQNVTSTTNGLIVLNSLYSTAILNQQYAQSLSTQSAQMSSFNSATTNYNILKSGSDQAAKNMAQISLSTITGSKAITDALVSTLKSQTGSAVTDSYNINVLAAQANVDAETQNVSTYTGKYNEDISSMKYYSSLYEEATRNVNSSIAAYTIYDGYYTSSIAGSNALMQLAKIDDSTFTVQVAQLAGLSYTVSSLYINYSSFISTYTGLVAYSTILADFIQQSTLALSTYSSFYDSASAEIVSLNVQSNDVNKQLTSTQINIDTYSSIIEQQTANMIVYAAMMASNALQEDYGAFKYKETLGREAHMNAQIAYNQAVLAQIQANSTNGISSATNLNTTTISVAYTTLNRTTDYVNTFSNAYSFYDVQVFNQKNQISTAVGHSNTYTTLLSTQMASKLNPSNQTLLTIYLSTQDIYNKEIASIARNESTIAIAYQDINSIKAANYATYDMIFTASEIAAHTSTISSFIIQGFNNALTLSGH
jgi:hypothetical protein